MESAISAEIKIKIEVINSYDHIRKWLAKEKGTFTIVIEEPTIDIKEVETLLRRTDTRLILWFESDNGLK